MEQGYYRWPTVYKNTIAFVSEDDLWKINLETLKAERLTVNHLQIECPLFSPDGKHIAFAANYEGNQDIYVIDAEGGPLKRLTYTNNFKAVVAAWTKDSKNIIYSSPANEALYKHATFKSININGGIPKNLNLGYGKNISFGKAGKSVIGRNTIGLERWKRYKGGTAGKIWIDNTGKGNFKEWKKVNGNLANPMWIDNRIYFISDHQGIGNLYSIKANGSELKKHTNHKKYYIKHASSDGKNIVFSSGADIYFFDIKTNSSKLLNIKFNAQKYLTQEKFVAASNYFQGYDIHPSGHSLAINARGRMFEMGNWEGATWQLKFEEGQRQRLIKYFNDGNSFVCLADDGFNEVIEIHNKKTNKTKTLKNLNCGRILEIKVSPNDKFLAIVNHKFEIGIVEVSKGKYTKIAKSKWGRIAGFNWEGNSKWLTYALQTDEYASQLFVYNIASKKQTAISSGDFQDYAPVFSYCNNYIFFISNRTYNPVYDTIYFDLNFPKSSKIYAIPLSLDAKNPFIAEPKTPGDFEDFKPVEKKEKSNPLKIDFKDITERIVEMPIAEGNYFSLAVNFNKLFYIAYPVRGALDRNIYSNAAKTHSDLRAWNFEKQEDELIAKGVSNYLLSSKTKTIAYRSGKKLRVISSNYESNKHNNGKAFSRKDGWIDLNRISVKVNPKKEWEQMFNEIWRLQKQQFWTENMSGVDWKKIYNRYFPLVKRLGSRKELSDLAWEMQGELGTSHAYEIGGDYKKNTGNYIGLLGCDFEFDKKAKAYKIKDITKGDNWDASHYAPICAPGVNAKNGDYLLAINNQTLTENFNPNRALANLSNDFVSLEIRTAKSKQSRIVKVKTIGDNTALKYRNWVNKNRAFVHKKTNGKVGYVHIPNMGPRGFAEFHRYYLTEAAKDALIVDVRFNGGGHVSQLLLEKLNRKPVAFNHSRWADTFDAYPSHTVNGPMVALTNEFAGSDGDIFSHNFKLMKLGKLIGKRTWGGVIGIWPRHFLVDGSVTTQPEFSFWFKDVGYQVENYGTDPDIEVDITPQDYKNGIDPQMEKAIEVIKKELKTNPPFRPNFGKQPDLSLPK